MKSKRILTVLGQIDDDYIAEAIADNKKSIGIPWLKWGSVAAGFILILTIGIFLATGRQGPDRLPLLTIDEFQTGGMGYEGYFAHNIDELVNNNPWSSDSTIKSLPVYKNSLFQYTKEGIVTDPNIAEMKQILIDTAESLGMNTKNLSINEKYDENGLYDNLIESIYLEDENYKVNVNTWMRVNVDLKKSNVLPEGYSLSRYASYDELYKTAEYILKEYADFIHMENACIDISLGDYDVDGNRRWNVSFYEGFGNMTERITNYNFRGVDFYSDDEGNVHASFGNTDLSDIIGDYPIIRSEEALDLLCKGKYVTSVPEEFPGRDSVKKVELIYLSSTRNEIFMPYYKFYVEGDFTNRNRENLGLTSFDVYYVPAVEEAYIKNMPQWDGH